jgi:hypothetical protein
MDVIFRSTPLVWDCVEQAGRLVNAIKPISRRNSILREVIIRLSISGVDNHSNGAARKPVTNATLSNEICPDLSVLVFDILTRRMIKPVLFPQQREMAVLHIGQVTYNECHIAGSKPASFSFRITVQDFSSVMISMLLYKAKSLPKTLDRLSIWISSLD